MSQLDFSAMRAAMVSNQLRTNNVTDGRVLAALKSVAREEFVPPARRQVAYVDVPLPCENGRAINASLVTSRLIESLHPEAGETALVVGAAGGYAAALLAAMDVRVVAVENDPALLGILRAAVAGLPAVEVVDAPLPHGYPAGAPYDLVLIDGAVEIVPDSLVGQVGEGGRLACGLCDGLVTRLASGVKTAGRLSLVPFLDAEVVVLPGFEKPRGFVF